MSGKQILITIGVAVLAVGVGGKILTIYWDNQGRESVVESTSIPITRPTAKEMKFLTWSDEAGFVFQYPQGLKIDNHPDDKVNYANLTITDGQGQGSINILMKDDVYKSLDKWTISDTNLKNGNILETSLNNKNGKKIMTASGQTIIGVIDSGVLVTITREAKMSPLLETAWEKIGDSWEFVYPTPTGGNKKTIKAVENVGDSEDVLEEDN